MQLNGLVTNAVDATPVVQAEVLLRLDELEIGKLHTDESGAFHVSDASDELIGKSLRCDVSKAGFKATSLQRTVDAAVVSVNIELAPDTPPPPRVWWHLPSIVVLASAPLGFLDYYLHKRLHGALLLLTIGGAAVIASVVYHRKKGDHFGFQISNIALWFGMFVGDALARGRLRDDAVRGFSILWLISAALGAGLVAMQPGLLRRRKKGRGTSSQGT